MNTRIRYIILACSIFAVAMPSIAHAQVIDLRDPNADTTNTRSLTVSAELRPRSEYRNGYRVLRNDTSVAAFFTSQRSRINVAYETKKVIWRTSIQSARIWGEDDPRSTDGTVQVFEFYVEPKLTDHISLRIGRQRIAYDDQRLFAENDWRQNARSHDALLLRYKRKTFTTELVGAFNQNKELNFSTDFSPAFTNYKTLGIHYLKYTPNALWSFTTLSAVDGYQAAGHPERYNARYTTGGRIELTGKTIYATINGYRQFGENPQGQPLFAFYLHPALRYTGASRLTLQLGSEIMSGNDSTDSSNTRDNSFVPLYGLAHRFMGVMDYFTTFPSDLRGAGLVNPYLLTVLDVTPHIQIRNDFHTFYSQGKYVDAGRVISKYLGFEHDILLTMLPNSYTKLDLGFSWSAPTKSLAIIKNGGDHKLQPIWAYFMATFKPELLKLLF